MMFTLRIVQNPRRNPAAYFPARADMGVPVLVECMA